MCNCTDNTTGQNCETCVQFFYRPVGRDQSASDACIPCNCNVNGITDDGDCVKVRKYEYICIRIHTVFIMNRVGMCLVK